MDEECRTLLTENLNKNLPDQDQYPHSNDLQDRCVNILASLWHAPEAGESRDTDPNTNSNVHDADPVDTDSTHAVGTATIGSSEAILLAGLAMKWQWRSRVAKNKNIKAHEITQRPNLVFSAAVHVSILKVCRYFDIDARIIPLEKDRLVIDVKMALDQCDENTCGIIAVLGTTLTGECDDVKSLNNALEKLHKDKGIYIPIHVDGASGAFVLPFVWPKHEWDFRLSHVRSINTSGHKYGLVLPGLGWIVWKTKQDLPADLVFHVNYLGVDEPTYTLNFSKSASTVIAQYYNFLRLGRQGYEQIMQMCFDNSVYLATGISKLAGGKVFYLLSKQLTSEPCLPLVAFALHDSHTLGFDETDLVHEMRVRGWIIPAYTLPNNVSDITICRVVVRETFSHDMANMLLNDLLLILISLCNQHGHQELSQALKSDLDQRRGSSQNHRHNQKQIKKLSAEVKDKVEGVAKKMTSDSDTDKVNEMTGGKSSSAGGAGSNANNGSKDAPTTNVIC